MNTFFSRLKRYWDIFGGIILGIISSIIVKWEIDKIQLIYSVIILILVYIGFLKVIIRNKKRKLVIDKVVDNQKPLKATQIALNPTKDGEELGELFIESMKGKKRRMEKIKKFFKWIWTYRQQIIGLFGAFAYATLTAYALITDKLGFILNVLPQKFGWQLGGKIAFVLVAVFVVYYMVRNQFKWVGVGGLDKAQQYLEEIAQKNASQLSPEAKKVISNTLKDLNKELKNLNSQYNKKLAKLKELNSELKPLLELENLGMGGNTKAFEIKQAIQNINSDLYSLNEQIASYKKQIENYTNKVNEF